VFFVRVASKGLTGASFVRVANNGLKAPCFERVRWRLVRVAGKGLTDGVPVRLANKGVTARRAARWAGQRANMGYYILFIDCVKYLLISA
jgi:hypothetical protein